MAILDYQWGMRFNASKCYIMSINRGHNLLSHMYELCGTFLGGVAEEKYLGVMFDSVLSFDAHISSKIRKANAIIGLIRRSFSYLDYKYFTRLYTFGVCTMRLGPSSKKAYNYAENCKN